MAEQLFNMYWGNWISNRRATTEPLWQFLPLDLELQSAAASGALSALGIASGGAAIAGAALGRPPSSAYVSVPAEDENGEVTDLDLAEDEEREVVHNENDNSYPTFDSLETLKGEGRGNMTVKSSAIDSTPLPPLLSTYHQLGLLRAKQMLIGQMFQRQMAKDS